MQAATLFADGYVLPRWSTNTDPTLLKLRSVNDASVHLLNPFTVNVSRPESLLKWLETNKAYLTTILNITALCQRDNAQTWFELFQKLSKAATNIKNLNVHWDALGPWGSPMPWDADFCLNEARVGLGRSVKFVQGLGMLKVKDSVTISVFYAEKWHLYLKEKLGIKPVDTDDNPGSDWALAKKQYRAKTEHFDPWKDTEDGPRMFAIENATSDNTKATKGSRQIKDGAKA